MLQAYLTTFHIEPGCQESITNVLQIVRPEDKFGFPEGSGIWFSGASEFVELAIATNTLRCSNVDTQLKVTLYVSCLCCFSPSLSL